MGSPTMAAREGTGLLAAGSATVAASGEADKWPLYALADYEGAGSLIELAARLLGVKSTPAKGTKGKGKLRDENQTQTTTCAAGAALDEQQGRATSGRTHSSSAIKGRRTLAADEGLGTLWWRLAEIDQGQAIERHRAQVVHLCLELHRAISSFLVTSNMGATGPASPPGPRKPSSMVPAPAGWTHTNRSRSLNQQPVEVISGRARLQALASEAAGGARRNSAGPKQSWLTPANIRRLSWRRQALAKARQRAQVRPATGEQVTAAVDELADESGKRRLAATRRTFSKPSSSDLPSTCLEAWIQASDQRRRLKSLRQARWSKLDSKRGRYGESLVHVLIVGQSELHLIVLVCLLHICPFLVSDIFESQKFKGLGCLHLAIAYSNERLLDHLLKVLKTSPGNNNKEQVNETKTENLISLLDQPVTGSLFRSPVPMGVQSLSGQSRSEASRKASQGEGGESTQVRTNWRRLWWLAKLLNPTRGCRRSAASDSILEAAGLEARQASKQAPASYWCDRMDHWPTANSHAHLLLSDWTGAGTGDGRGGPEEQQQQQRRWLDEEDAAEVNRELMVQGGRRRAQNTGGGSGSNGQMLDVNSNMKNATRSNRLPIYLGDTPLAWAVSFGARTMYERLAEAGANQNARDAQGNTCLHRLAINRQTGWCRFLLKSGASSELVNALGFTPLLFACHLGHHELFEELLELSAVEFWSYSMIRCCGYPLTSLDSCLAPGQQQQVVAQVTTRVAAGARGEPGGGDFSEGESSSSESVWLSFGKANENNKPRRHLSVMSVILESQVSDNEQKSQLLSSAVVKRLLEEKWRIFARRLFYHELLLTLAHLALMTLAISLRPAAQAPASQLDTAAAAAAKPTMMANNDWRTLLTWPAQVERQQWIRHLAELSTALLSAFQLVRFVNEWRLYGNMSLQWTYNPLLPNLVAANGLIVLCALLRLAGQLGSNFSGAKWASAGEWARTSEDVLLVFAAPLLWSSLLFFIAAFRVTGPFVAMIRYMIVRDLRQFSLIYLVFFHSFAQCIFFVNYRRPAAGEAGAMARGGEEYKTRADEAIGELTSLLVSYLELCMDLFKMTLGVYDLQPYRHSSLARLFFLLFLYLIPILFNMLIAMMNNTYSLIISQSERAWSFQWARTLFALERRLSDKEKSAYLRLYSINMVAPSTGADKRQRKELGTALSNAGCNNNNTNNADSSAAGSAPQRFVPALMIIKRMSFTRAERRRLILGHWQKSIKSILNEIKRGRK